MTPFYVKVLGTSSSQPAHGRFPSCQIVQCGSDLYMIDCGEGAQIQLSAFKINRNKIKSIFISHMHGDHIFGLPGVLTSFFHYQRQDALKIIGPVGIRAYIDAVLTASSSHLGFEIHIEECSTHDYQLLYSDLRLEVYSLPLLHRLPTMGFLFKLEVKYHNIVKEKINDFDLSFEEIRKLKNGESIVKSNELITTEMTCYPKEEKKSYAYLSDTIYLESIIPYIKGCNLIYHETTYLMDKAEEAAAYMHSTSIDAATIAKKAQVDRLIVGHYSSRYKEIDAFEVECKTVFHNTTACKEGDQYEIV